MLVAGFFFWVFFLVCVVCACIACVCLHVCRCTCMWCSWHVEARDGRLASWVDHPACLSSQPALGIETPLLLFAQ